MNFQTTLRAYHGDPEVKATYLARVRQHARLDELIHDTYWEDGKGCAVGCTIHGSDHARYETELGIPRILARLEDRIFEGMANGSSQQWPAQFLATIRVGADLSLVWPRFAIWLLIDPQAGVVQYARTEKAAVAIRRVAELYGKVVAGETVATSDWQAAAAAAYAAAAAAAAYAAYAAATAAAAANAADAANAAANAATARTNSYERMAKKLLALLKAAPVPKKQLVA
jgi:hypothetical protein